MKLFNRTNKILPLASLSLLMANSVMADKIDISKATKDILVMTKVMETSLQSSAKAFPGKPHIEGLYLAKQGYLFSIRLNGISGFGLPGIASWDAGRLELDIPEIITEALASIDYGEAFAPDVDDTMVDMVEPVIESLDSIYEDDELKVKLKELREQQRNVRRETYEIRREIRKIEDEKKRQGLEQKLEAKRKLLKKQSEEYSKQLNSYKNERQQRSIKKSDDAITAIFNTVCDYGSLLKSLNKDEKFTLMVKGGVDEGGKNVTQTYVLNQKSVKNCSDSKKLQKNAIYYTL